MDSAHNHLLKRLTVISQTNGNRIALEDNDSQINYIHLEELTNKFALEIVNFKIESNALIVIYLTRGINIVIALLAILKSNCCYTIVEEDEGNFEEHFLRIQSINPSLVITEICNNHRFLKLNIPIFDIEDIEKLNSNQSHLSLAEINTEDIAYVIFTSGSTGKPKGVMITHSNINHYTNSLISTLSILKPLNYLHASTFAADLGNTCLFLSLWTGGTLHIMDTKTRKTPSLFFHYLIAKSIDVIKLTPTHWNALSQGASRILLEKLQLKFLILGGELLSAKLAKEIIDAKITNKLINHYGPSETTVGVLLFIVDNKYLLKDCAVPIGRPIGLTEFLIKNKSNHDNAINDEEGELYIGGPSVSKGYLNDQQLTSEKFIFNNKLKMIFYKTGDWVRLNSQNYIEFIGRTDRQIKINGYRVELGYIENTIEQLGLTKQVAVNYLKFFDKFILVAAIIPNQGTLPEPIIFEVLKKKLPEHMIPHSIVDFNTFPINANGKINIKILEKSILKKLKKAVQAKIKKNEIDLNINKHTKLIEIILTIWKKYLKHENFTIHDNFYSLGGNSIEAILIISELQAKGFHILMHHLPKELTIQALVENIKTAKERQHKIMVFSQPSKEKFYKLSSTQKWFFEKKFNEPDHWNQAMLLETNFEIEPKYLEEAIKNLIKLHPMLLMSYFIVENEFQYTPAKLKDNQLLTTSVYKEKEKKLIEEHILQISENLHKKISINDGIIFQVHLFQLINSNQLLLVCHHLSIDIISWNIIISDLIYLYELIAAKTHLQNTHNPYFFGDWVHHLEKYTTNLTQDLVFWKKMENRSYINQDINFNFINDDESQSESIWISFSVKETNYLTNELPKIIGVPIHIFILAVFSFSYSIYKNKDNLIIDVESHGRVCLDDSIDISRIVGWFTSIFPINLQINRENLNNTIECIFKLFSKIPNLGIAYGYLGTDQPELNHLKSSEVCYNYLGNILISQSSALSFKPSSYAISSARGNNKRIYPIIFSVKILQNNLIFEISYLPKRDSRNKVRLLMQDIKKRCQEFIPFSVLRHQTSLIHTQGSSIGLLTYVPPELYIEKIRNREKKYNNILLTGSTGYLGIHVLKQLLLDTSFHIYCIIRDNTILAANERLLRIFQWYFPNDHLSNYASRISILCGDMSHDKFSLSALDYENLSEVIDAIYHFSADTRLFGKFEQFELQNVTTVERVIQFSLYKREKDLHYMSTLAVCGINPQLEPFVFSERDLFFGQAFQNGYEKSKFLAEKLMNTFIAHGGRGFIYRAGNVSGHSMTGKFQINAGENRFIQFLNSVVKLGKLPNRIIDLIQLTPIDETAKAISLLSLNSKIDPGIFHIDNNHSISLELIFENLIKLGISFQHVNVADFSSIFNQYQNVDDPVLNIGRFWVMRPNRNVIFNHNKTIFLLKDLGFNFKTLDSNWIFNFVNHLLERNIFDIKETVL